MEIKADVHSISKLKDYFFIVPDYQREYVWSPDDQVEQFIMDIDNEFEPGIKEQKGYFIGSIIIVANGDKFDVIDGQQRLTTIVLSLCAFRDILKPLELDAKQKKYLQTVEELLSDFDINTDETLLRLELQYAESKDYLSKLIQQQPFEDEVSPSIKKMQLAHAQLKQHFQGYLNQGISSLTDFVRYFLTKIELVVIESENLSSALKIFETINQRGAGLNAMDLIKNLLFSHAKESEFQQIKETWKELIANLQACKEENSPLRFLRYFLMSRYYDGILREDDIYKWIISPEGKAATRYESEPLIFAKELKRISKRYSDLVNATESLKYDGLYPAITSIGFINKYKSRQHLVLLLSLGETCSVEAINYLAAQIESFFFYSNTLGIQAKNNERIFANWASKLRGTTTSEAIAEVLKTTMLPYISKRIAEFKTVFTHIRHSSYNPQYRVRFILGKLENTLITKAGLPKNVQEFYEQLQLEHILPQTPKGDYLPEEFEDKDDYKNYVYRLGNVTLLESTINQALNNTNDLSSNWFETKQKEYLKSSFVSSNLISHEYGIGKDTAVNKVKAKFAHKDTNWGKEAINNRQKLMLELAFETWKIAGVDVSQFNVESVEL